MKPQFSFVAIARNEANTLPRLVASLSSYKKNGGEIVILDTGSTDDTVKIAQDLGCKVVEVGEIYRHEITQKEADEINNYFLVDGEDLIVTAGEKYFDFASARNHAAKIAENDIVFFVDCDEIVTGLNIEKINEYILNGVDKFKYHFVFSHKEDGTQDVNFTQSKAYDRRKMQWLGVIHEYLSGTSNKTVYLTPDIFHLEHWQNHKTDRSGYLRGLAIDCYSHLNWDRNSHYFAREMLYTKRYKSAIKEFQRHILMGGWPAERGQSYVYIGDCYIQLGEDEKALKAWFDAFELEPKRREPLLRLAWYWHNKKNWQKAVVYAMASLQIPKDDFYSNKSSHYTYEPHEILYINLWWLASGQNETVKAQMKKQSLEHFLKALSYCPNNPKYNYDKRFYDLDGYNDIGIEGWMTGIELGFLHNEAKKHQSICEIGSWKGRSTHALLTGCSGKVTAVDHFEGSNDAKDETQKLAKKEDIYSTFLKNVGHFNNLEVVKLSSKEASEKLNDRKFDMIFIDAEHTYNGVKQDILAWKDKATKIICGHDYCSSWPDVIKAVDEVLGKPDEVYGSIWVKRIKPLVSVVIPTLGREEKLNRCIESIKKNADWNIEIIVEKDNFKNRQGCAKTLAKGIEKANGEYICFLGNDCIAESGFIKEAMIVMDKFLNKDGLVSFNDGRHEGKLATHWVASKKLLPYLDGYFFNLEYNHTYCDNELTERCKLMNKYAYAPLAKIKHDNPLLNNEEWDAVLKLAYQQKSVKKDKETFDRRKAIWGLQFTGERVVPDKMEKYEQTLKEHLARYIFALEHTVGKTLDAPCGTGYGTNLLNADGCDCSNEALDYARAMYKNNFFNVDLESPDIDEKYNTVVCFEGLEHLIDPKPFIDWVEKTADRFIFSIPVNNYSKWHKQVYSIQQIKDLFKNKNVEWYEQTNEVIKPLESDNPVFVIGIWKITTN